MRAGTAHSPVKKAGRLRVAGCVRYDHAIREGLLLKRRAMSYVLLQLMIRVLRFLETLDHV